MQVEKLVLKRLAIILSSGGRDGRTIVDDPIMTKRGIADVASGSALDVSVGSDSSLSVSRMLDVSFALGSSHVTPKLPWEQNTFLRSVLGPSSATWLKPVTTLRSINYLPIKASESNERSVQEKKDLVREACHTKLHVRADTERMNVLLRWADIFMLHPMESHPGKLLLSCAGNDDMVMQTMLDLFARKSTSTIRTRAGSFAMYIAWALKLYPDDPVFPIEESKIYSYACACRDDGRSASRIDTLLGTLRYVGGEFGFTGAESAAKSPRVVGAAHSMLLNRPPRRRAESLTPSMIAWFEIACFAMPDAYDRVIAGMCMLCCMGRLRCSDVNRVRHAGLIGRFIEGALSRTKTSRSKEKATTFIPLVVPSFGVLGRPWFIEFVKARQQLGLRAIPSLRSKSHDLTFLMVPEHASIVYDLQEPLSAGELTGRMRSILAMGYGTSDLEGISSHSLKATLLAYMNMFGCDLTTSELLGYHVNKEHSSALNYTRDCLSNPVRSLTEMLNSIHRGTFVPTAARDERFKTVDGAVPIEEQFRLETGLNIMDAALVMQHDAVFQTTVEKRQADERLITLRQPGSIPLCGMVKYLTPDEDMTLRGTEAHSSSSQSSSSDEESDVSDSSSDEDQEAGLAAIEEHHEVVRAAMPSLNSDMMRFFRHNRTKMVHCGHVDHSDKTGCGRKLSEAYYLHVGSVDNVYPKCKHCFGALTV